MPVETLFPKENRGAVVKINTAMKRQQANMMLGGEKTVRCCLERKLLQTNTKCSV